MSSYGAYQTISYEVPAPAVARIVLDRPEVANAQDKRLLHELNAAFDVAVADMRSRSSSSEQAGSTYPQGTKLRDKASFDEFTPVGPDQGGSPSPATRA